MGRAINDDGTLSEFEEIGKIVQGECEWTESLWGDERLFFGHSLVGSDLNDIKISMLNGDKKQKK